ncbi:hypothetical protein [Streptomyces sp. NPDC048191]|uniref:hypothetical protein n=1 Tax=Streptomyces sp. NPDC048191 TaxID=3155484 RepID=UPI0033F9A108
MGHLKSAVKYVQAAHPDEALPRIRDRAHRPHPAVEDIDHALGLVTAGADARHSHLGPVLLPDHEPNT